MMAPRNRYKFWSFLISILLFAFCKKRLGVVTPPPQLSVPSSEELFSVDDDISKISITNNSEGDISNSASWCAATVFATEGDGEIYLSIQPNTVNAFYLTGLRQGYN
jgi:hypothetical protein